MLPFVLLTSPQFQQLVLEAEGRSGCKMATAKRTTAADTCDRAEFKLDVDYYSISMS